MPTRFVSGLISLIWSSSSYAIPVSEILDHFNCRGHYDCQFLKRGLARDTEGCQTDPNHIEDLPRHWRNGKKKRVQGRLRYMGVFPKRYQYKISGEVPASGRAQFDLHAKVFLWNQLWVSEETRIDIQTKLMDAAQVWNRSNPYAFDLRWELEIVDDPSEADHKIWLLNKQTRGPYDSFWSKQWNYWVLAHEMGHFFGLDDEYKNSISGGDPSPCLRESIMCWGSTPRPYHYYLVMRRALCQ